MGELLLDTTYLLPAFGIGLELDDFGKTFSRILGEHTVLYNPVSLIEAKWTVLRMCRNEPGLRRSLLERYRLGLRATLGDERLKQTALTDETVERTADSLLVENGVRDYFDRTIYATACARNCILLTEDRELRGLKAAGGAPRPRRVLDWRRLGSSSPGGGSGQASVRRPSAAPQSQFI